MQAENLQCTVLGQHTVSGKSAPDAGQFSIPRFHHFHGLCCQFTVPVEVQQQFEIEFSKSRSETLTSCHQSVPYAGMMTDVQ